MIDILLLKELVNHNKIQWSKHTLQRMMERDITRQEVKQAILCGEIIEEYIDDKPYPSCLIFSFFEKVLHVVVSIDTDSKICYIITAYRPDLEHFEEDYKTRRIKK
jgi:hypothetical protein